MRRGFSLLPKHTSDSRGTSLVRMLLLILVFVGVGWLYTRHFDSTLKEIQNRASVVDRTGVLSSEQMRQYREFAAMFRDEFGIDLVMRVADGPVEIPKLKSKTMFLGVDTKDRTLITEFPVWMRRALGEDFIAGLERDHMAPYFDTDSWPTGIMTALKKIWDRLMGLETRETGAQ